MVTNVKRRSVISAPKRVLKGEAVKIARFNKWLRLRQKETNAKVLSRLQVLGKTFNQQSKGL